MAAHLLLLLLSAAHAACPDPAQLHGVAHQGTWTPTGIQWRTEALLVPATDTRDRCIQLAVPVDDLIVGGRPIDGETASVAVPPGVRRVVFEHVQTDATDALRPPLPLGASLHRLTLEGASWRPDAALGIESHIRYWSELGVSKDERKQLDALVGSRRTRARDQAIYFRGDGPARHLGLEGAVAAGSGVGPGMLVFSVMALFAVIAGAVIGQRAFGRMAAAEARRRHIENYLKEELQ
jgi:hypothetical protein